jgi:DNA-binding MarR family transcriptional regulator
MLQSGGMQKDGVDQLIDQWRREKPDLPVDAMEILARFGRVAALGERKIAAVIAGFGLKLGEFDVLATLRRSGSGAGVTPTELYRALMLTSGAVTHRLDRLEEAGLVERRDDPNDKRGYRIALTRKGLRLIDECVVAHVANEEQLLSALTSSDRQALNGLLRKMLAALQR